MPPALDATNWTLLFSAAFLLAISPGPDMAFILSRTAAHGAPVGLASAAGASAGAMVHVLGAAVGVSAILATSALAFMVLKWLGAGYLLVLGVQALRAQARTETALTSARPPCPSPSLAFRQAALVDVLNPKVALFFLAFLPQFVSESPGEAPARMVLLGAVVIAVLMVVETGLVLAAARTTACLRRHPGAAVWLQRAFGAVLVGLAFGLARTV
jgi:threonine/homoserine/homoserine lactone efflux protein